VPGVRVVCGTGVGPPLRLLLLLLLLLLWLLWLLLLLTAPLHHTPLPLLLALCGTVLVVWERETWYDCCGLGRCSRGVRGAGFRQAL